MIDAEDVADLCYRLGMTREDVWWLCKAFHDEDSHNTYVGVVKRAFAGNIRQATRDLRDGAGLGGSSTTSRLEKAAAPSTTCDDDENSSSGNWTFADFERFSRQHLIAFYPLFQIQRNVRCSGNGTRLGESYWIQKSREKIQVQQLLVYMRDHQGRQPPLALRDWLWSLVSPTAQCRVRELALKLYIG